MKKASLLMLALFAVSSLNQFANGQKIVMVDLKDEVTVRRDSRDIPYIEAKNDSDLYFMQGYSTARDRLWQMDLMRRLARGETAEIFGSAALEQDKRWRRFGFGEVANQNLGQLSPELRAALGDYARGVNAYIASLTDKDFPLEFQILQYRPRQWSPTDSLVIGKILADALSTTWQNDLLRAQLKSALPADKFADVTNQVTPYDVILFGKDAAARPASAKAQQVQVPDELAAFAARDAKVREDGLSLVGLYAEDLAASNNWVISGKRTADGKPILANDPHLQASAPGIWYLVHLSSPNVRVSGVTLPGSPGVVLGHNDNIAWGATNVGPDVQDLYVETFNDQGQVKTATGWQAAKVRHEIIKVRANPLKTDTTDTPVDYTDTPHGPVITEADGKKYALKWTALDSKNGELRAFFDLNHAKNWDDFKADLKSYGGPTQNFVYADVKGNIGWYAAGRIPIRRTGDGAFPYDGSTTDGDWTGYIPFEELPNLYNPAEGLIVTANQRTVGTSYKYTQFARDIAAPWRARDIYNDLSAKQKITMDDVRDVQYETFNIPVSNLAKTIVKLGAASPETLEVLKVWDGRFTAESRGAVLATEIRSCMATNIAQANKPVSTGVINQRIVDRAVEENLTRWLPAGVSDFATLIKTCDATARTSLADPKRYGPDPANWVWGKFWVSRFPHPLAAAPLIGIQFGTPSVAINGSGSTPNVGSSVSMRLIASPGNWDATRHVIPLGESGDPRSPHFKDQFDAWRTGTPMIFPFSKQAVEKAAVSSTVYAPK
jgi:penicillin amidase